MEYIVNPNFEQIVSNMEILGGKPCIKGTRISVDMVLEWLATGAAIDDICKTYTHLSKESVVQAILFAASRIKNEVYFEFKKTA